MELLGHVGIIGLLKVDAALPENRPPKAASCATAAIRPDAVHAR
jgi:hypothetical protein